MLPYRWSGCATQLAKTEAEAAEFGQAVEGLAGAGVLAFSARAGRRWLGKRRAARAARLRADAINKKPYNPREMEAMLKENGTEVTSTTLPPKNAPNVKMAGSHKERTLVINAETQETLTQRIVFDERGFPILDPYVKLETRISGDLGGMTRDAHMRAATRQLRSDIEAGRVNQSLFSDAEFSDIKDGLEKIGNFTWHHHQEAGRMQLVPEDVHRWVRHVGGKKMWGKNDR